MIIEELSDDKIQKTACVIQQFTVGIGLIDASSLILDSSRTDGYIVHIKDVNSITTTFRMLHGDSTQFHFALSFFGFSVGDTLLLELSGNVLNIRKQE